jgi:hypothetical protein
MIVKSSKNVDFLPYGSKETKIPNLFVSKEGEFFSKRGDGYFKRKTQMSSRGNCQIQICGTGQKPDMKHAARLLYNTHVGPIKDTECIGFINDDSSDIRLSNLKVYVRTVTPSEVKAHGESNGKHKLTEEEVSRIAQLFTLGAYTDLAIAGEFGVHKNTIQAIRYGISWSWLTGISKHSNRLYPR